MCVYFYLEERILLSLDSLIYFLPYFLSPRSGFVVAFGISQFGMSNDEYEVRLLQGLYPRMLLFSLELLKMKRGSVLTSKKPIWH